MQTRAILDEAAKARPTAPADAQAIREMRHHGCDAPTSPPRIIAAALVGGAPPDGALRRARRAAGGVRSADHEVCRRPFPPRP